MNLAYAIQLYRRVIDIMDQKELGDEAKSNVWGNFGYSLHQAWAVTEGIAAGKKAIELNPNNDSAYINISAAYNTLAMPELGAEYAEEALRLNPASIAAADNLGVSQLLMGQWQKGWANYEISLGKKYRKEWVYGDEVRWDGSKDKIVIIYGEQGLGDEIQFASIFNEAIEDCEKVIIDCDVRLEGLFKRSFPSASVFGTRQQDKDVFWQVDVPRIDARCSMGTLPKYYRNHDANFPGKPYLVADPDRRVQWRALLDSRAPEIKIGIAWTGGTMQTGRKNRCIPIEDLRRLCDLDGLPVFWVSLEYIEPDPEIKKIPIHHWKRATDTDNYDDTAALVKELDLIVCVPTTVTHLAGALGKETWCLVPKHPNWRFGLTNEQNIWHSSVRHIRQGEDESWGDVVDRVRLMLEDRYARIHRNGQPCSAGGNGADVIDPKTPEQTDSPNPDVFGAFSP